MSMISEQVKKIRSVAGICTIEVKKTLLEAADTIEALSAKLQAANVGQLNNDLISKRGLLDKIYDFVEEHRYDGEIQWTGNEWLLKKDSVLNIIKNMEQSAETHEDMTLNEAIEHLNDILQPERKWDCEECRNEHIQLREWLLELQERREQSAEDDGKWIIGRTPVKEECEGCRGHFLVTVYANELKTMYMEYEYVTIRGKEVGRWIWCDRVNIPWKVIAWRKLPEPYLP